MADNDTIAAIATPPGNGGVGVIRLSGPLVLSIAQQVLVNKHPLKPRQAQYSDFLDTDGSVIDSGIVIYFQSPKSFTGEDVLELQGHGGHVVMDMLLRRVIRLGARLARPGEFSERAFLNDKLDLLQAEAIADLINSSTEHAVRSAQKSMQGHFSQHINELVESLTELRCYVEAAIDFVDEEIDFLSDGIVASRVQQLRVRLDHIEQTATQGRLLRDGMTVVLVGKPNVGKSSLLNALAGHEAAIVTDIAGTTRDVLRERIQLDGMPLHIIDTAGLHESDNAVEQEGMRRAHLEIAKADKILLLSDVRDDDDPALLAALPRDIGVIKVRNKIDLSDDFPHIDELGPYPIIYLSLKQQQGLDLLKNVLKKSMGFESRAENVFIARRRHLESLADAKAYVSQALHLLELGQSELVAEELRHAQNSLGEITGQITSDDLLGKIFATFCIGK